MRRMMAFSLGKIPTTRERLLISLFSRSDGLVHQILTQCSRGGSATLSKRVNNTDKGGDWADVKIVVTNSFLEADPCANINAKAADLGSSFTGNAVAGCERVRGGHRRRLMRSGNRSVTFRMSGEVASGHWAIPDPNWWAEMPIRIEAVPEPDAARDVVIRVVRSGAAQIHADNFAGIGTTDTVNGIKSAIESGFSAPIKLADVPAVAGLLSAKVLPDGAVALYFRPDIAGRFAAVVAQNSLDDLEI